MYRVFPKARIHYNENDVFDIILLCFSRKTLFFLTFQAVPLKKAATKAEYRKYSPSAMTNAYRAVLEQNVSVKRASITYGVPQTTLRQRVLGRINPDTTSSGPSPVLSQEEEAIFVEHLKCMAQLGYGYTASELVSMASNYAVYLQKRDAAHPFGRKWYRNFMKRWPELRLNKPRSLTNYRAKATSESVVKDYFERLNQVMTKLDLKDKPHCIYNVDEKGIQTEHSPPYIVSADKSVPAITSSRSSMTTILGCGNALGNMMPPFYIFKGKRLRSELLDGSMAGSSGTVTDSGWSNSAVFQDFLQSHFLKYLQRGDVNQTVLLIFDGHKSHINIPVINWAKEHNIELFVLPAHTSHMLQPLDVGCFGPLQRIYNNECHKFMRNSPSTNITRYNVAGLSSRAYELALSVTNLKSSFKRTGIYPFDPSVIHSDMLKPATAFSTSNTDKAHTLEDINFEVRPSAFFKEQAKVIEQKRNVEKKEKNTLSKITSGTSITDSGTVHKIQEHQRKMKIPAKRKCNNNQEDCVKPKSVALSDPLNPSAGPSGLHIQPDSDSEAENDIAEEDKCCVCHKFQPEELKNCVSLIFTQWAQCDYEMCKHWTHLTYCCKVRVVRRHDQFICPCHNTEE